jgi:Fe-S cluster assembly protein SufB
MAVVRDEIVAKEYKYGFHDEVTYLAETKRGLTRATVEEISAIKEEPEWMLQFRLRAFDHFVKRAMPTWVPENVQQIDFGKIVYYRKPSEREERSWDDVPEKIKQTFERLGIPEAERKFLAGVGAQYDSEVVYHSVREELTKLGVVFMGMDQGLREHEELVRKYFATVVPPEDNKFAALNSAVWSGGSFVYVPRGVEVPLPLQAYFRINAENTGQFERTLIIADEGSKVHYIEGCLPEGELVSLGDEMVPIESIGPGTLAMNSDGDLAPVVSTRRRQYRGDMVKIVPVSVGNAFELTPEHPVWTIRRPRVARSARRTRPPARWDVDAARIPGTEPEWVPAGELAAGDLVCFPVATQLRDHPELSDDLLRFLGYYLAEGSAFVNGTSGAPTVTLSFHIDERDEIEDAMRLMTALAGKPAALYEVPTKREARAYVYSRELLEMCHLFAGRLAAQKRLHPAIMELPAERQALLVGTYLRGDGSRHLRANGRTLVRATTVSRTLAYQLQEILARMGTYAGIQVRRGFAEAMPDGRRISHREAYTIHFEEGRTANQVWHDPGRSCFWVPIRRIDHRDYDGWVYNLEMASAPNAYLARGFAVHNCTAPIYTTDALHAAVVEVIALPGSKVRYTTIQNWSRDVFNLVTKRAHAHARSTVEWVDANTGCLTGDSLVYKNNDLVPIAEIEPGDMVYSLTPEFEVGRSRVVGKRENPPEQVYNVVLRNHREVRATANHPFLVARKVGRTRQLAWTSVASIVPGDEIAIVGRVPDHGRPHVFANPMRRPRSRNPFTPPVESSEDLMWLLGFYVGDGCLDGENRVTFAVADSDPARPALQERLRTVFGVEARRARGVQLRVNSAPLVDWLRAAGFAGTADTKRLPDWIFRIPHAQKRAFVEGYIAADGHVREGHRNVSITSTSWTLLEQVRSLAISAGMNATKISTWTRRQKLPLGTREKSYATSYLYFGDETLDGPVHFVPILTIEPAGEHVTYDIEVEGTANFIANGVFVHNSRTTVKYPAIYLRGEGATAEVISVAFAGHDQHQDTGAKAVHLAPNTRSRIVSKSVAKDGGRGTYRGTLKVAPGATGVVASVRCDALLLDEQSRSDTYPYIDVQEDDTTMTHEATVGRISQDQIFYIMSRGLTENEATNLVVQGFLEIFTKELPMEYAIEFNRLVKLEMEGALG